MAWCVRELSIHNSQFLDSVELSSHPVNEVYHQEQQHDVSVLLEDVSRGLHASIGEKSKWNYSSVLDEPENENYSFDGLLRHARIKNIYSDSN